MTGLEENDAWLQRLAKRQQHPKLQDMTSDALTKLFAELQRCSTVYNFHADKTKAVKVFTDHAKQANIIHCSVEVGIDFRNDRLALTLNKVEKFFGQERMHEEFRPYIDRTGIFYWQNKHQHNFSNGMLTRKIFAAMAEHAND